MAKKPTTKELELMVAKATAFDRINEILYYGETADGDLFYDPQKEWSQDEIELVAEQVLSVKADYPVAFEHEKENDGQGEDESEDDEADEAE